MNPYWLFLSNQNINKLKFDFVIFVLTLDGPEQVKQELSQVSTYKKKFFTRAPTTVKAPAV